MISQHAPKQGILLVSNPILDATTQPPPTLTDSNNPATDSNNPVSVAPPRTSPTAIERFFDSFFQERNIKWMLLIGAAIVFGSSLMLVTKHWSNWSSTLKFLTIVGYTSAIYLLSEVSRKRLGLVATAHAMQGLTLVLLPMCYLALSWLAQIEKSDLLSAAKIILLLIPVTCLTVFASYRIFKDWLLTSQPTFLASFVILCVAGALPPVSTSNDGITMGLSAVLWLVMTVGVIKVNRHVFWMTEEYRRPRVFGFLPIGLLSLQFIILLATKTLHQLPLQWIGLGCVMTAATVFMTARTIAGVVRQRTGDLVRPLPWNIVMPILIGLVLTAIGVCLSCYQFSFIGPTTYAVVPTAIVAACLMATAGWDTRNRGFVWASLILTTLAYQCTPTLIAGTIQAMKSAAASSLNEERLPIAFYGLTYLPLILTMVVGSRVFASWNRKEFSQPLKQFATGLSLVLFVAAFSHVKAIFIVSLVNVPLFLVLAIRFRDRRTLVPALFAIITATATLVPFNNAMGWSQLSWAYVPLSLSLLAIALTSTNRLDRWIQSVPLPSSLLFAWMDSSIVKRVGLSVGIGHALAVALTAYTFASAFVQNIWGPIEAVHIAALMTVWWMQSIRMRHYATGICFWLLPIMWIGHEYALGSWIRGVDDVVTILELQTPALVVICLACRAWIGFLRSQSVGDVDMLGVRRSLGLDLVGLRCTVSDAQLHDNRTTSNLIQTMIVPLTDVCHSLLIATACLVVVPQFALLHVLGTEIQIPITCIAVLGWIACLSTVFANRVAVVAITLLLPIAASALLNGQLSTSIGQPFERLSQWLVIWATAAGLLKFVWSRANIGVAVVGQMTATFLLMAISASSFLLFDWQARVAAMIALSSMCMLTKYSMTPSLCTAIAILGNVQVFYLAAYAAGLRGFGTAFVDEPATLSHVIACLSVTCAASVLVWQQVMPRQRWWSLDLDTQHAWLVILRCVYTAFVGLAFSLSGFSNLGHGLILAGLCVLVLTEILAAMQTRSEARVWTSLVVLSLVPAWLVAREFVVLHSGVAQFALTGIAAMMLFVSTRTKERARFSIFANPLEKVGLALPAIACGLAIWNQWVAAPMEHAAWTSIATFAAAGVYLFRAIQKQDRRYYIAAGVILNGTLLMTWRTMGLTDAQWYLVPIGLSVLGLVELLRKELPKESHDPLRYAGALAILVSPVFNILDGSWVHLLSLMGLSLMVVLLAIGFRLRALMYTGTAFLLADLLAMVVRSSIENQTMLWVSGLGMGAAVIALAAYCERHREQVLQRIRMLSSELATWK
jgi:hypothetical protein